MKKKPADRKPADRKPAVKSLVKAIAGLAREFRRIEKIAEQEGLFLNHRELLECPCGLEEDVMMGGRLIVCRREAEGVDIGLRFPEPDKRGKSRCPACGRVVKLPEERCIKLRRMK